MQQLDEKRIANIFYHDQNLVFCNACREFLASSTIDRHLRKASEAIHCDMINLHDFRHTFSTRIAQATGDLDIAKTILGHDNINTTSKHYRTVDHVETKAVIEKIAFIE